MCVAGYCYVDYGAGGYRGWKEDGGELDLEVRDGDVSVRSIGAIADEGRRTRRLSSVSRTATPASTLPTVSDINILRLEGLGGCCNGVSICRDSSFREANLRFTRTRRGIIAWRHSRRLPEVARVGTSYSKPDS